MKPLSFDEGELYYYVFFRDRESIVPVIMTLEFKERIIIDDSYQWRFSIVDAYDDNEERLMSFNESTVSSVLTLDDLTSEMASV